MRLEAKKYLYDMQQAVALLTEFTAGKTFADYERDAMLRAAVERKFEIVGEALHNLPSWMRSSLLGSVSTAASLPSATS